MEERARIDAELVATQREVAELGAQLAQEKKAVVELEKKLNLYEPTLMASKEKRATTKEATWTTEERAIPVEATAKDATA